MHPIYIQTTEWILGKDNVMTFNIHFVISTCIRQTRACSTCAPHVTRCLDTAAPLRPTRAVEMKNVIKIRVTVPLLPKCCCMDDKAEKASRNIWLWTWTIAVLWLWCTVQGKRLFEWSSYAFMQYSHCRNTVTQSNGTNVNVNFSYWKLPSQKRVHYFVYWILSMFALAFNVH